MTEEEYAKEVEEEKERLAKLKQRIIRKMIGLQCMVALACLFVLGFFTWMLGVLLRGRSYGIAALDVVNVLVCFRNFSDILYGERSSFKTFLGRFIGRAKPQE